MFLSRVVRAVLWGVPLVCLLAVPAGAWAQLPCASCATSNCPPTAPCRPCPPYYHHVQEGPPRICIKCGCPRPVCVPCDAPHWGYYQTCWRPWPWPPDWSHCPGHTPAATVMLAPLSATPSAVPAMPGVTDGAAGRGTDETPLPAPRKLTDQVPPPGGY
jgi:hypothetical protein